MIDINPNRQNQQTITKAISVSGIGLHSGKQVEMKLVPAEVDHGVKFIRSDKKKNNVIDAIWSNVSETVLSTTISNQSTLKISTIEHLMSALSGLHIDNLTVYINSSEVPIMDGSSRPFVDLIEKVGIKIQNKKRKMLNVKKPIEVKNDKGLALGGSLNNAVVVGKNKILNKEGLRYSDEFVRHKILDSIGDLYLAGSPIIGYFYGNKSGHQLNNQLLRKLFSNQSNYEYLV